MMPPTDKATLNKENDELLFSNRTQKEQNSLKNLNSDFSSYSSSLCPYPPLSPCHHHPLRCRNKLIFKYAPYNLISKRMSRIVSRWDVSIISLQFLNMAKHCSQPDPPSLVLPLKGSADSIGNIKVFPDWSCFKAEGIEVKLCIVMEVVYWCSKNCKLLSY